MCALGPHVVDGLSRVKRVNVERGLGGMGQVFGFACAHIFDFLTFIEVFWGICSSGSMSPVNEMLIGPITVSPRPTSLWQSPIFPAGLHAYSNSHTHLVLGSKGRQPLQVTHFRAPTRPLIAATEQSSGLENGKENSQKSSQR